jgi:hypothetical protein
LGESASKGCGDVGHYLSAVAIAAIVIAVVALFFAYRATMIATRALAVARAARRDSLQRGPAEAEPEPEREPGPRFSVSLDPGPDHDVGDDGAIWTAGSDFLARLILTVTNDGERPSGRTEIDVWLPRAQAGDPWWAEADGATPMGDVPQAVPDADVRLRLDDGAPTYETVRLSRVLDRVEIGVSEHLRMCAHFELNAGRNAFPVDVVVGGEDAGDEAKHRAVIRIVRRY